MGVLLVVVFVVLCWSSGGVSVLVTECVCCDLVDGGLLGRVSTAYCCTHHARCTCSS